MNKIIPYIFIIVIITVFSCRTRDTNPTVDMTLRNQTLDKINAGQVYGSKCGMIGTAPILRVKSESFISEMKIDSIQNWFNDSLNIIKQVYATESLIRLYNLDSLRLTELEINKIQEIKSNKQTILTCSGCVYSYSTIEKLLFSYPLKNEK